MKVVVFNGSPRGRHSNTHEIVRQLLQGASEAAADTEEVFLIEHNISQCRGCFGCWGETPGACVIEDDMAGLLDQFLESDYAGLATPVYNMYMTGLLKNFTDRFLPLATPHIHKNADGSFYHEGRTKRFPRQFFVANSGFPGDHNFDLLAAFVQHIDPVLKIFRNCGEVLRETPPADSELASRLGEYRDALRSAGREMVVGGSVSQQTVQRLQMELLSDEEYMAGANEYWDGEIGRPDADSG